MPVAPDLVTTDGDAVVVAVHVQPRAGRTAVVGRHGDALKVRVAAPPVDDRANEATIALLADVLDVPASAMSVVAGARSRMKRVRVQGIDHETAVERVERALELAAEPPGPRQRRQR
ncbi:MAG: DUF167 domain-containing protein [Acidimicrobiia bacterium]